MCAITGIWRLSGEIDARDRADLKRMTGALRHRGPDGEGYVEAPGLALGHRRLAILDLTEYGAQPMQTQDALGLLSYNGEVYNHAELRLELERQGVRFRGTCDSETVLQALHHWGPEKAVPLFNGMFALAYYDGRDRTLWLARDRLGIKPLSLHFSGRRLLFASEDKAFLTTDGFSCEVDSLVLAHRLVRLNNGNMHSLLRKVDRLQPGTIMAMQGDAKRVIQYWQPLSALDPLRIVADRKSDGEKLEELEQLFGASVEMHLASDAPLAACLSGGVDSGLITAFASRFRPRFDAYVLDPDLEPNEASSAARTAAMAKASLHRVPFDRDLFLRQWPAAIQAQESEGYVRSAAGLLSLTEMARGNGIKVLLTGEGSDELFGGYPHYQKAAKRWQRLDPPWAWFRRDPRRRMRDVEAAPLPGSPSFVASSFRQEMLSIVTPGSLHLQREIAAALSPIPRARDRGIIVAGIYDLSMHLQELLNRHDRIAMAKSVEIRVPFLENRLIDFAMHLPARHRLRRGVPKWLLKKMAEDYIPRENIYKSKLGFPLSTEMDRQTEWLLSKGLVRDILRWSDRDTSMIIRKLAALPDARTILVGAEIFARIFTGGESADSVGESLLRHSREYAG